MNSRLSSSVSYLLRLAPLLLLLVVPGLPAAPSQESAPSKEISEKVGQEFAALKPLIDAKQFPEAIQLLTRVIGEVPIDSYDFVVLSQMMAQVFITQGAMLKAVEPLQKSLIVAERHGFFEPKALYEQYYLLSQIHYQHAVELKDLAAQQAAFEQSYTWLNRAMLIAPKPTIELQLFAASLLYNQGSLGRAPNLDKFKQALVEATKGLVLAAKPPEQLYQLMLACYQQLGDLPHAAETLETIVALKPQNPQSWQQLVALYMNLAGSAKQDAVAKTWNLRAIISIERAQALGMLNTPPENYTLVALYYSMQQFARAADLLENGLREGRLATHKRNWELLSNAYQQMKQEPAAIAALQRAIAIFPIDGQLEYSLAQLYYSEGRVEDAYSHTLAAAKKPNLEKPGQVQLYLAYLCYELGKLDDAGHWADQASQSADVKTTDVAPIQHAISEALRERAALATHSKA